LFAKKPDSQPKAREACDQKMNELQPQTRRPARCGSKGCAVPDETHRPDVRWKKNTFTPLPGEQQPLLSPAA